MKSWELALYLSGEDKQDFEVFLGSTGDVNEVEINYEDKIVIIR